jgi:hypothetical protein
VLRDIVQTQSFVYEAEFKQQIDTLAAWTMQANDQQLINIFMPFHSNYHNLCFFANEYASRLKSVSASCLISLAMISALQEQFKATPFRFVLKEEVISSLTNPIIKSLLAQVNQERNFHLKKQAVKAVADLMFVGQHFKMDTMCRKTLRILLDMVVPDEASVNPQLKTLVTDRSQAVALFCRLLIKQTRNTTIFELFNGFLGVIVLRPAWALAKDRTLPLSEELLMHLKQWVAIIKMMTTCIEETVYTKAKVDEHVKKKYVSLVQQAFCDLIAKVFNLSLQPDVQQSYLQ